MHSAIMIRIRRHEHVLRNAVCIWVLLEAMLSIAFA